MSSKPNILLIMCDDLGFGDVGFNGGTHIQTPHLDRLADDSQRFERFYAGGPVCSPTRGTVLTGRHYIRYGINHANQGRLPTQEITLASLCKEAGYATGHFGKWHLGTLTKEGKDGNRGGKDERLYSPPWLHDFDRCFSTEAKVPTWDPMLTPDEINAKGKQQWGVPGTPFGTYYWNERGEKVTDNLEGCDCRVIVDRAEPFIRGAVAEDTPFLSVVWFHAPHTPVVAGPEWLDLYPDASEEEQHYYGCVSAMDAQVGRLVDILKETNALENTLIWFCSDNGPETPGGDGGRSKGSTGGLRGRKRSLYEGGVGVPTLVRWPGGQMKGKTHLGPTSTLDILPTCCALAGLSTPTDRPLDGENILPLVMEQKDFRQRPIPYRFFDSKASMFDSPTFAISNGPWKFLTNLDDERNDDQLYNLESDRGETHNLVKQHPEIQREYREELSKFLESCRRSHAGEDYDEPVDMIRPFQKPGGWRVPANR